VCHCAAAGRAINEAYRARGQPFRQERRRTDRRPLTNHREDMDELTGHVARLVEAARRAGADAADAVVMRSRHSSVSVRLGKVEATEAAESDDVSLRVFV